MAVTVLGWRRLQMLTKIPSDICYWFIESWLYWRGSKCSAVGILLVGGFQLALLSIKQENVLYGLTLSSLACSQFVLEQPFAWAAMAFGYRTASAVLRPMAVTSVCLTSTWRHLLIWLSFCFSCKFWVLCCVSESADWNLPERRIISLHSQSIPVTASRLQP